MEEKNINELRGWDKNPRGIKKDDYQRLKNQIQELGLYKPFLITEDGTVLGGNMRLRACQELGITKVPVSVVKADTDELRLKYALSDNDRAGYYEEQQLAELVMSMPEIDLGDYKVDLGNLTSIDDLLKQFGPEPEEDEAPPLPEGEPESKLGEVYQLGRHRVMCGDSTKIEDVEKLMDGKKADITFHSPPYNVGKTPNGDEQKYVNDKDNKQDPDYIQLLIDTTNNGLTFSEYVFVNLQSVAGNKKSLIEYQYQLRDLFADYIIWDKGQAEPAMAYNVLNSRFEFVYIFSKRATRTIGTIQFRGNIENIVTITSRQDKEYSHIHKATYPVSFATFFIKNFSEQSVLDLFLGTGTTLIAAEQTNRTCYGMELDPRYVDVIRKRYAKFIGKEMEWETITPSI